jgi:hypothetical protein
MLVSLSNQTIDVGLSEQSNNKVWSVHHSTAIFLSLRAYAPVLICITKMTDSVTTVLLCVCYYSISMINLYSLIIPVNLYLPLYLPELQC